MDQHDGIPAPAAQAVNSKVHHRAPHVAQPAATAALGGVAHDLRGLITVVKGYAELLQEEFEQQQGGAAVFSRKILRSCALMQELVENCLDLGRIQAGRLSARRQPLDLVGFLEETTSGAALRARSKEIAVVVDVVGPLPTIDTDPTFLERILDNLLGNAIKFSPPRSSVQVVARAAGAWVELEVSDSGPGIDAAAVPELFEAYRQGAARPTGGEKTTGLGLAVVKELVSALGGTICVQSRPGSGATFSVALPNS